MQMCWENIDLSEIEMNCCLQKLDPRGRTALMPEGERNYSATEQECREDFQHIVFDIEIYIYPPLLTLDFFLITHILSKLFIRKYISDRKI